MSLSERSTSRGYARRADRPQSDAARLRYCLCMSTATGYRSRQRFPSALVFAACLRRLSSAPAATASGCCLRPLPLVLQGHRHHTAEPGTPWTPEEPTGAEPLGLLHRERSCTEDVPIGTSDDGALHQVLESLPQ